MKWLRVWSDSKYEVTPGMRWTWYEMTGYLCIMIYQVQMLASKIINPSKSLEILKPKLWILKDYRTEMSDINNNSLRIDKSRIFWINFWIYHSCNSCVFLDCIFSLVLYFKLKKRIEVLTYAKYPISYGPYVCFTRIELHLAFNAAKIRKMMLEEIKMPGIFVHNP